MRRLFSIFLFHNYTSIDNKQEWVKWTSLVARLLFKF